jgi:hypothetical protein
MCRWNHIVTIVLTFWGLISQGQEVIEFYNGIRGQSMGGAAVAVVNDETALYVNPAGLGKLRNYFGTVFDPEIEATSSYSTLNRTSPISTPTKIEQVSAALALAPNAYYHYKQQISPSFVVKNFGFGVFWKTSLGAIMNTAGTELTTKYYDDMGIALGYNLRFFDGRIKFGFNGKLVSRIEVDKILDPAQDLTLATNGSEGVGISVDSGLMLAAPWHWLPTLAIVARDVGGTTYNSGSGVRLATATRPAKQTQDIDVGVAIFPIHGNYVRSSWTAEIKKYLAYTNALTKTRYMHFGYELNLGDIFFIRLGMNQNYWTAGAEIVGKKIQFQLSSYGEDVGTDGVASVEDRRFGIKFAYRY